MNKDFVKYELNAQKASLYYILGTIAIEIILSCLIFLIIILLSKFNFIPMSEFRLDNIYIYYLIDFLYVFIVNIIFLKLFKRKNSIKRNELAKFCKNIIIVSLIICICEILVIVNIGRKKIAIQFPSLKCVEILETKYLEENSAEFNFSGFVDDCTNQQEIHKAIEKEKSVRINDYFIEPVFRACIRLIFYIICLETMIKKRIVSNTENHSS